MRIENKPTRKKDAPLAKETSTNSTMQENISTNTQKSQGGRGRTRSWTFIVYPDSAPINWREIIDEEHVEWVESPLHDKDTNADGTPKKPHWHILIMFESVKEYHQVLEITTKLNCTVPQKCNGAKGLVRYMAHIDNPEKIQYSVSDIKGHGGADVMELLRPTSADRYALIREMINFIRNEHITEFSDMMLYAAEQRVEDWFPLLCDNSAYVIGQVIKSERHKSMQLVDTETGEIIE